MKKKPTVSKLKKKLDTIFSQFIRLRNKNEDELVACFTCDRTKHWKQQQCGHFQRREKMSTRFDETNCQVQCVTCNVFKDGEQYEFAKRLDQQFGKGTAEALQRQGNEIVKLNVEWYNEQIAHYTEKVKEML